MYLFVITVVFAAIYLAFYPGLVSNKGSLGWTSVGQLNDEAAKARAAAAQALLQDRLARLARSRATSRPERASWRSRCAELARRPLPDDTAAAEMVSRRVV
jgi:cytochrome c oxidase cbb3-type subunit 3